MKNNKGFLEHKANIIKKKFSNKESFTVADMISIFPELKKNTIYWTLSNLTDHVYIKRIGKGLYAVENNNDDNIKPILSKLAKEIMSVLNESGYEYFITGLDILSVFMEHIPESFPVLLFGDKYSIDEIYQVLRANNIDIITDVNKKNYLQIRQLSSVKEIALLKSTTEFSYSKNGIASFEKAFVDIYYAVTRNNYPLSIQELARIFINMKRRIMLNSSRIIKIASRRNLHNDIRYILDYEKISKSADNFVKILSKV